MTSGSVRKASTTIGTWHLGHDRASTSRTRFISDAHDSRLGRRSLGGVDDGDAVGCVPLPVSVASVTGGAIGLWPVSMVKAEGEACTSTGGGGSKGRYFERFANTP